MQILHRSLARPHKPDSETERARRGVRQSLGMPAFVFLGIQPTRRDHHMNSITTNALSLKFCYPPFDRLVRHRLASNRASRRSISAVSIGFRCVTMIAVTDCPTSGDNSPAHAQPGRTLAKIKAKVHAFSDLRVKVIKFQGHALGLRAFLVSAVSVPGRLLEV